MNNYISIRLILDDCLHHPLLLDLTLERAVNYALSFIQIVGMPTMFINKTTLLQIDNYRASLPDDYHKMILVRTSKPKDHNDIYLTFIESTDSFHMSNYIKDSSVLTYKIQGSIIYTSIKEGTIEISYQAIAVDGQGFPLIPDNSSFIRALELYIKKQHFTILFDLGKINPAVYNNVQQEYAWAVGLALSDLIRPSLDEMQSITNMWNTLITRTHEHNHGFKTLNNKETLKYG